MIRSRPGFSTVITDDSKPAAPAKLNRDMEPAFARRSSPTQAKPTLHESMGGASPLPPGVNPHDLQAKADAAMKRLEAKRLAEATKVGPEILVNPTPSEPPIITSPHQ